MTIIFETLSIILMKMADGATNKRFLILGAQVTGMMKAHNAVARALAKGSLTKEPCSVCRNPRSHAHHEDYNKPLEVVWLCALHHKLHHIGKDTNA